MKHSACGALIVFEGGDGAGKSTQATALATALRREGRVVTLTREPGGTPLAESVRSLVLDPSHAPVSAVTEALLFASARADHVARTIRPALERGEIVICDRFVDSSVAYQGAGRELGTERVLELNRWAVQGLVPELTVLLDVDQTTAEARRRERALATDRMESEARAFHDAVNAAFRDLATHAASRYLVLDASAPVTELSSAIMNRVMGILHGHAEVSA